MSTKAPPYLPPGKEIQYVPEGHPFMVQAKATALAHSNDHGHPTGIVLVKDGEIIGRGYNHSPFHKHLGCVRKLFHAPTGKYYWACPGCSPWYHAEQTAIRSTQNPQGADVYLWGHWWCCHSCWDTMISAGIGNVYLPEGAYESFGAHRQKEER